ncbi:hypothetical protein [Mumia sp. DW29H23]|uniref:hypothetical protein n=1 Tax=Mumia sp. DW29H23 TaxID=3421241 RepID=UPI003D689AF8
MPEFVSVLQGEDSDVVVTVSAALAKSNGLEVVDVPATDANGRPLSARRKNGRPIKPRVPKGGAAATTPNPDDTAGSKPEEGQS